MDNPLKRLVSLGQSPWYDNIERRLLSSGEMAAMVERGDIRGVTSNPSIFQNAIARSTDYNFELTQLAKQGKTAQEIYESLAIQDIQTATELFTPLYKETQRNDGYVSLEVSPFLAHDSEATILEAQRLWMDVSRPNLMVKIPATKEGLPAIRRAIAAGININVTLIFSLSRYDEVMEAYLSGLEDRSAAGLPVDSIASVASFFVSRLDTKVDDRLKTLVDANPEIKTLCDSMYGRSAIASAKLAYQKFQKFFSGERFQLLKEEGAQVQRPLWASTSTKNPAYPDTLYVDNLIGPFTVNTMPPQTLMAFNNHGTAEITIDRELPQAQQVFSNFDKLNISLDEVTMELEMEGVKAFSNSFESLLQTIEQRRLAVLA
jgi:transaldolase